MTCTSFELPFRRPYDFNALHKFFSPRTIKGVEVATHGQYARTFRLGRTKGTLLISASSNALQVTVSSTSIKENDLATRVATLFNLATPSTTIASHFATDKTLAPLVAKSRALRVPGSWDPFELGVRAILGQQVSVAGATTLAGRIAGKFGMAIKDEQHGLSRLFPQPEQLADATLVGMGLTTRRAATITGFARSVCDTPSLLDTSKTLEQFVSDLVELDGFGPWTAHYMAMRLGYADAFPASDLGVRKALNMAPEKDVLKLAESWRPWRATAVMYLWNSLSAH
ncbi:MAG: AlkA N-terminal domain-containing protein [Micropepsaceae bacterium]